jgi:hypothetical protein
VGSAVNSGSRGGDTFTDIIPPAPDAQPRAYEALGGFRPTPLLLSF